MIDIYAFKLLVYASLSRTFMNYSKDVLLRATCSVWDKADMPIYAL